MFNQDFLDKFISTAIERHKIYLKKEAMEPKPWTEDPIYQRYFFCNVFRQYDKCSKWVIDKVVPLVNDDLEKNWFLIFLYRFISTYEIFKGIEAEEKITDLDWIYKYLSFKKESGEKIFNGCFIRNPNSDGGWTQTYKVPFLLIEKLKKKDFVGNLLSYNSIQDLCSWLSLLPGVGGFMSYEYACDFEYTDHFNPVDKYRWCNKGPGAQQGLSLVIFGNRNAKFSQPIFMDYCRVLFDTVQPIFKKEFPEEDFSMREVEHWLCEFQKYIKYLSNLQTGRKCSYRIYKQV
jgi:hypothetical protein